MTAASRLSSYRCVPHTDWNPTTIPLGDSGQGEAGDGTGREIGAACPHPVRHYMSAHPHGNAFASNGPSPKIGERMP